MLPLTSLQTPVLLRTHANNKNSRRPTRDLVGPTSTYTALRMHNRYYWEKLFSSFLLSFTVWASGIVEADTQLKDKDNCYQLKLRICFKNKLQYVKLSQNLSHFEIEDEFLTSGTVLLEYESWKQLFFPCIRLRSASISVLCWWSSRMVSPEWEIGV